MPSTSRSSKCSAFFLVVFTKNMCSSSPQMHKTTHLSSISLLDHPIGIRRGFVIKLLIMKIKPVLRHLLPLSYKYLPQQFILECSQPGLISHHGGGGAKCVEQQTDLKILQFILYILDSKRKEKIYLSEC